MSSALQRRILLDGAMVTLLLVALAYYWQDNRTHEVAGASLFVLLAAHNTLNRRWYGALPRRQEARRNLDKVLVLALLVAFGALIVTSVMISQSIFSAFAIPDAFTARRIHALAAYWVLLLVGIHLGIRWPRIVALFHAATGTGTSRTWPALLRAGALGIAAAGIHGSFVMDVGAKLTSGMTLDTWDFSASVVMFFLHHVAIVGLYACATYYLFAWLPRRAPESRA